MQSHLTVELANSINAHALTLARGDHHTVAKQCAKAFVEAFEQCYTCEDQPGVFLVCGPGMNGLIGLYAAALLKRDNYEPAVYTGSITNKYMTQIAVNDFLSERNIPYYDFLPSTLSFYFSVVVDALLGMGFDGGDIREPFWDVFEMLVSIELPVASVDVPSGWDLTLGPREVDRSADTFVKPDLLVSLAAPKLCAKNFKGEFHFIAGRHVPQSYLLTRGVLMPSFPGDTIDAVLFESHAKPFQKRNGERMEQPGTFNATLFTKNPDKKWVDIDEEDDLWDELE